MTALKRNLRVLVLTIAMVLAGTGTALARPLPVPPVPTSAGQAGPAAVPPNATYGVPGWETALIAAATAAFAVAVTLLVVRVLAHRHHGRTMTPWSHA